MNESNTGTPWFKQGEFFKVTKSQFRARMAPSCDLKTRIWACLMLHTAGFRGELAQVVKKQQVVPMRLPDVAKELRQVEQEYYQAVGIEPPAAITDWNVRRKFRELEEDGACERRLNGVAVRPESNLISKEIQIFVWFEPKKPARQIIKRTRIRQEPMPIQAGLFDRRTLRWIEKTFRVETLDPRIPEFLKSAQSDPRFAEAVSVALGKAAAAFSENLPLGEIQLVEKADIGATKKQKNGHGRNEKADMSATKSALHNKEVTKVKHIEGTSSSTRSIQTDAEPVADDGPTESKPSTPENQNFPLSMAAIAEHDPAVTEAYTRRVAAVTIQACTDSPEFPNSKLSILNDKVIAACIRESYRTGPKNHGTGLLLKRVPQIAIKFAPKE